MNTYFVRHSSALDVDNATLKALWEGDYIGIHYPHDKKNMGKGEDSLSLNPEEYSGTASHTLARLKKIGKEGGFIFAAYRGHPGGKIGFIVPGTEVELFHGKWGNKNGLAGRDAHLKVLKVKDAKNLSAFEGISLTSVQPRQGTLCQWSKVGSRVKNLVSGKVSIELGNLTSDLQEVMCMEFMRTEKAKKLGLPQILYTLMPVGRTMKDLDIIAISNDYKPISVQVTYHDITSNSARSKLNKLDPYFKEGSHTVLFCKCSTTELINNHIVFPLSLVFEEFCTNSDHGKVWYDIVSGSSQLVQLPSGQ